jgi:hypothetical protein
MLITYMVLAPSFMGAHGRRRAGPVHHTSSFRLVSEKLQQIAHHLLSKYLISAPLNKELVQEFIYNIFNSYMDLCKIVSAVREDVICLFDVPVNVN